MSQVIKTTENTPNLQARVDYSTPPVNLNHDVNGFTMTVEMPGVAKNGVEISFDSGKLTLVGHRAQKTTPGERLHVESTGRDYRRVFDLDPMIDSSHISANLDQGMLTIHLPKQESAKPRKIAVS